MNDRVKRVKTSWAQPLSRGWFGAGLLAIAVTLGLAIVSASRSYGQQEQKVQHNIENIDRLQERTDRNETRADSEMAGINATLKEQHGVLAGLASTLEGIQRQMESERSRDRR